MFSSLKDKPRPTRASLLAAIPVHNQLVNESPQPAGLRLSAPRAATPLRRLLSNVQTAPQKSFDLDDLGAFVWHSIDGQRSVENLIHHFASEKRVNLREAEVAVLAFLKTLTQRNLIALAVLPSTESLATVRQTRRTKRRS